MNFDQVYANRKKSGNETMTSCLRSTFTSQSSLWFQKMFLFLFSSILEKLFLQNYNCLKCTINYLIEQSIALAPSLQWKGNSSSRPLINLSHLIKIPETTIQIFSPFLIISRFHLKPSGKRFQASEESKLCLIGRC